MSYASHAVESYLRRIGITSPPDAAWQYQVTALREMLGRLEIALDDEGVDRQVTERVIRCMLHGTPSLADAELRHQQEERIRELLEQAPVAWPWGG